MNRRTLRVAAALFAALAFSATALGQTVRLEETSPLVRYSSNKWLSAGEAAASGRAMATTHVAGSAVSVAFRGTGISWIGYRCRCAAGKARVYLDGVALGTVETWKPEHGERLAQAEIYRLQGLSDGDHVFTVEATGDYNRAGDSAYIAVDAFDIIGTATAPADTTRPEIRLVTPTKSETLAGPVTWTAQARDNVWLAGVRFLVDGEQVGAEDLMPPYAGEFDTSTMSAGPHVLTAVARDWLGNETTSTAIAVRTADEDILQDNDVAVSYTGDWIRFTGSDYSGGTAMGAWQAGASATLRFKGTGFSWIGVRGPRTAGIARLRIDGRPLDTVVTFADKRETQSRVYRVNNLSDGEHVLTIDVTGDYSAAGESAYVVLDAFRVVRGSGSSGPIDVVPPTAVITPPAAGTTLSGMARITVDAYDNNAIAGVRLYANGRPVDHEQTRSPPYYSYWDTTTFANGDYTLMAVARDQAGNIAASHTVSAKVFNARDTGKPSVKFTAPAADARVTGNVTLSATAFDNVGVTAVRFYAGTTLLGEDNTPPYSITRDTGGIPSGNSYVLTAEGIDAAGNVGTSAAIRVTVDHTGG